MIETSSGKSPKVVDLESQNATLRTRIKEMRHRLTEAKEAMEEAERLLGIAAGTMPKYRPMPGVLPDEITPWHIRYEALSIRLWATVCDMEST